MLPIFPSGRGVGKLKCLILNYLEMETNEMTPEQSLQVISDAIAKSRKDFERNAGTPMILWGAIVLVFSVVIWLLLRTTDNLLWNFLWFGIPLTGWPLLHIYLKDKEIKGARNFVNDTIGQIWIGYGIFALLTAGALSFIAAEYIGVITMTLLGYAAAMTGMVLKNRFITIGGFITGIGGVVALCMFRTCDVTLAFSVASVVSLILPGIMMNRNNR
jgi:cobalamin synthase